MNRDKARRRLYPDARPTSMRRYRSGGTRVDERTTEIALPPFVERLRPFFGAGFEYSGAALLARMLQERPRIPSDRKVALIFSAAVLDRGSRRMNDVSNRVAAACAQLVGDAPTRAAVADFGARFRFSTEQIEALLLCVAIEGDEPARFARAAHALASAFPADARAQEWGRMLEFADRACSCLAAIPAPGLLEKLQTLRMESLFASLPADVARRLTDLSTRLEAASRQSRLTFSPEAFYAPLRPMTKITCVPAAA
jgi:hypothetical protein